MDAVKTLSLPFTSNYNYQPPQSYSTLFQTQPSLAPVAQAFSGYSSSVSTPAIQQQSGYGGSMPVQQQLIQQPIAQQQGSYSYANSAPTNLPVQQQANYGGYSSSAPVQQQGFASPVSTQPQSGQFDASQQSGFGCELNLILMIKLKIFIYF